MEECIYSCQHPVWGGAGACVENNDQNGLDVNVGEDNFCLCEDGFVSRDSYGAPSCVRAWIQLLVYIISGTVQFAGVLFLAWHAAQHRNLPIQIRTSRRAKIRLRLSISTSVASAWFAFMCSIGLIRTWTGYLLNTRIILVLLILAAPIGVPACIFAIELWIDSLPQVLVPGSLEARLKPLAERHQVFFWAGSFGTIPLVIVSGISLVYFDVQMVLHITDYMVSGVSLLTGACILFLGVRISRAISRGEAQARPESRAFYGKARGNLRTQVGALSGACALFSMILGANEFLPPARWTPVFVVVSYFTVATSAFVMAVHFSRPNLTSVQQALPKTTASAYAQSAPGLGLSTQKRTHKNSCFSESQCLP